MRKGSKAIGSIRSAWARSCGSTSARPAADLAACAPPSPSRARSSGSSGVTPVRPGREREPRAPRASGMPSGSWQWWCRMSQTTRMPVRRWHLERVAEREGAVVVLDDQPRPRARRRAARSPRRSDRGRPRAPPAMPPTCRSTTASGPSPIASSSAAWTSSSRTAAACTSSRSRSSARCTGPGASTGGCRARGLLRRTRRARRAHSSTWRWNCGRSGWLA